MGSQGMPGDGAVSSALAYSPGMEERYSDNRMVSIFISNALGYSQVGMEERYSGDETVSISNVLGYLQVGMERYNMKSGANKLMDSFSRFVKAWLLWFVIAFTLLIIVKGPAAYQQYSFINHHQAIKNKHSKEHLMKFPSDDDKLLGGLLNAGLNESSCLSRYQWNLYRNTTPRKPSPHLISKLRDYEALHKHCGPKTAPYNTAIKILQQSAGADDEDLSAANYCKYVIWTSPEGLGNRMLSLVSSFLYALLTNRVLLLRQEGDMSSLFCEPFPETSWLLPSDYTFGGFDVFDPSFPYRYGNMVKNHSITVPPIMYINLNNHYGDADKRFFCDDQDQTHGVLLGKVTWLVVASNQYFLPSLFLMPSFQKQIEQLFPKKQTVFHHLGRYLFHPTNDVWGLITRYYDAYLAQADEKLGIQIRVFSDKAGQGHPPPNHILLDQILACTIKQNLLPKLHQKESSIKRLVPQTRSRKVVLVTSLRSDYYEELKNMYWQNGTNSGEVVVAFYQPSHEQVQQSGNEIHDMKALAEVYLLSLSDKLVISGWSTFGYVAHALGGLQPWILYPPHDTNIGHDHVCQLSLSMEPCFHFPPSHLDCGNDTSNILPYVRHCEDVTMGLKLFDR